MQENHTDLRVLRTKTSIQNAFIELIEEKGFDAITVKDITMKAKINRGTFYAHYQDKYDLMTKSEEAFMQGMSAIILNNMSNVVAELETYSPFDKPFALLVSIFEYIDQNKRFMKGILGPNGDLSFQTKLKEFMFKKLFEDQRNTLFKQENLLVPPEYLVSYIASAHIGVIQQWLNSEKAETPIEMARILSTMTINGPFFAAGLRK